MTKNTNIPKLRFKEYSEPWTSKSLGDITNCVDYRGRAPIKTESGIFLVTAKNIKKGYIDYECSKEYVSVDNYSSVMSKGLPKLGDILFTTEAPMGNIAMVDNERIALAQRVIKFRGNESIKNSYLLYYMLSNVFQKSITLKSFGTTVQGISSKELQKEIISFPNHHEQSKIASFLTAVDDKLQALKKKKELLEQYKKGMMQQLFSQEIRFKKDDGTNYPDWEEKRLGDLCLINMGQSPSSSSYNNVGDGFPLIQGNADIQNRLSNPRNWTTEMTKECLVGDIILTVRAPVGAIAKSVHNACIGRGVCSIRSNSKSVNEFIYQFLFDYESKWGRLEQGSTFTAVSGNEIRNLSIMIPSIEEQTKIANFLSAIDEKIAHCQSELDGLEQWKKGLLQQLFC